MLDFTAASAGTRAVIAHPMQREAALVLKRLGGDPSEFAARQLTARIASQADLILTMTNAHRDAVLELAPQKLKRTFTLVEAAQLVSKFGAQAIGDLAVLRAQLSAAERTDVPDPIGQDFDVFSAVGSQVADLLVPVLELCRRASTPTVT